MKRIALIVSSLACLILPKTTVSDTSTIPFYLYNSATHFALDVSLMYSICKIESNCRPNATNHDDGTRAQKEAGIVDKSYGLFQIKPSTAESLGFIVKEEVTVEKFHNGRVIKYKKTVDHTRDLLKPEINSWYAAKYLRRLYDKYGDTVKVVSAYNAGHYTRKNKEYVSKVLYQYARYKIDKQ